MAKITWTVVEETISSQLYYNMMITSISGDTVMNQYDICETEIELARHVHMSASHNNG